MAVLMLLQQRVAARVLYTTARTYALSAGASVCATDTASEVHSEVLNRQQATGYLAVASNSLILSWISWAVAGPAPVFTSWTVPSRSMSTA